MPCHACHVVGKSTSSKVVSSLTSSRMDSQLLINRLWTRGIFSFPNMNQFCCILCFGHSKRKSIDWMNSINEHWLKMKKCPLVCATLFQWFAALVGRLGAQVSWLGHILVTRTRWWVHVNLISNGFQSMAYLALMYLVYLWIGLTHYGLA